MMQDGLRIRATHAATFFADYTMNSYGEFYQSASAYTEEFNEKDHLDPPDSQSRRQKSPPGQ